MKTSALLFLLFMFTLVLWTQMEESQAMEGDDFVAKPIEEIEELFRQKQYQNVIDECERLIAYDPRRWEAKWARMKLSECYVALGQPEKAQTIMAEAKAAISHPREQGEILMSQLRRAVEIDDIDHADKLADELVTKFIGDYHALEAMELIIEFDLKHNRLEEARRRIDRMLQEYPFQDHTIWLTIHLSEHHRKHGQHQLAIEFSQKILAIHPDRVEVLVQLAETYREGEKRDQAMEMCDAAITTSPAHWTMVHIWLMKGEMLKQKGDFQGALKAFLTAGEFRGADGARLALRQAAECYHNLGETNHATALLTQLSQGYPDRFSVEVLIDLARAYAENFDYDRVESTLKDLVESYPQTHHAHEAMMGLLEMYWETNQCEKAVHFFGNLLANPSSYLRRQAIHRFIEASHEEGVIAELEARNELPELVNTFRQAVNQASSPASALAPLRGLAVIAQWLENWDEAIKVNTRLIEDYKDLLIALEARERLAECYKAKGEFDQARDQVNQILAIAPEGPRSPSAMLRAAHYQLAREFKQSEALELLRQLTEKYPRSEEGHRAREMLEQFGGNQ